MPAITAAYAAALPALRGTDASATVPVGDASGDAFTRESIRVRLPAILRETAAANAHAGLCLSQSAQAAILGLADEIAANAVIAPLAPAQPEQGWEQDGPFLGGVEGVQRYLEAPFFLVEEYMYKRLLDIVRTLGAPAGSDVFAEQKRMSLEVAATAFEAIVLPLATAPAAGAALLRATIYRALWGNRADLSLSAGAVSSGSAEDIALPSDEADLLLSDDSLAAVELLLRRPAEGEVVLVLDNCGLELLSDLVLAQALLRSGAAARVALLCKSSPVFVSDALTADVSTHVAWIRTLGERSAAAAALAADLEAHLEAGKLTVEADAFFTSPLPFWELPEALAARLRRSTLAIIKGDANYRRLLGDRHWPRDTPFARAVSFWAPCPLLALRTLKAGLCVGLSAEAEQRAAARRRDWLTAGVFGIAQLSSATRD